MLKNLKNLKKILTPLINNGILIYVKARKFWAISSVG